MGLVLSHKDIYGGDTHETEMSSPRTQAFVAKRLLSEMPVKKGITNVELLKRPTMLNGKGKNSANSCWFNHGAKSLLKSRVLDIGENPLQ